jgi:hypothetical protein
VLTPDIIDGAFNVAEAVVLIPLLSEKGILVSARVSDENPLKFPHHIPEESNTIVPLVRTISTEG